MIRICPQLHPPPCPQTPPSTALQNSQSLTSRPLLSSFTFSLQLKPESLLRTRFPCSLLINSFLLPHPCSPVESGGGATILLQKGWSPFHTIPPPPPYMPPALFSCHQLSPTNLCPRLPSGSLIFHQFSLWLEFTLAKDSVLISTSLISCIYSDESALPLTLTSHSRGHYHYRSSRTSISCVPLTDLPSDPSSSFPSPLNPSGPQFSNCSTFSGPQGHHPTPSPNTRLSLLTQIPFCGHQCPSLAFNSLHACPVPHTRQGCIPS